MEILYSPRFKRSFKKLSKVLQQSVWKKIGLFRESPFHPSLKTHKLAIEELWAFSVDYKNRVIFQFLDDSKTLLVNVGDHSIYRKV